MIYLSYFPLIQPKFIIISEIKMVKLSYVLIKANHLAQIPYSLSHRKTTPLIVICPGEKGKDFYSTLNINANYKNVYPVTAQGYNTTTFQTGSTVVILQPPQTFEALQQILNKAQSQNHTVILTLLQQTKKYLNIIVKKINNLELSQTAYSPNKFVGINDKIRDFVDKSYDMNRAAFYAYGEFINVFRLNLLKKIFRTELISLDELARSYGFSSAQRVKQGTFLKVEAQKANKTQARKRRKTAKKTRIQQQKSQQKAEEQTKTDIKELKKTKKIAKPAKTEKTLPRAKKTQ